jgi:hypothetical protein
MKGIVMSALVLTGCSSSVNPPQLGEPTWEPSGGRAPDAGETPDPDSSAPEAASLKLLDASLATLPREGNVSCFGQTGQSQLEWSYDESSSTAWLLVQETEAASVVMGQSISCALMTAVNADQCAASVSDSSTMVTWNVSFNPTTNTFAGVRYSGLEQPGGMVVTTARDFTGNCMGSWGDL